MCHLSRFACKRLCVYACNITLQGAFMQLLVANMSLQAPVVDFVSATREHETAKASMKKKVCLLLVNDCYL
jgi:hypothetical protein